MHLLGPRSFPPLVLIVGTVAIAAGALLPAPLAMAPQDATPDTPGAVALLAGKTDAPSLEALTRAISSDTPLVRAVAARTAAVSAVPSLADTIAAAFERERDATAAAEQARALLFLRGEGATASIDRRLVSVPEVATPYGEWLARRRPEGLPDLLGRLPAEAISPLLPAVKVVLAGRPVLAERLLRAWLAAGTATTWNRVLDRADVASPGVAAAIVSALGAENGRIREETVWALADRLAHGRAIPASLLAAAGAPLSSATPDDGSPMTWERFGREVIGRGSGLETPDRSALIRSEGRHRQQRLRILWLLGTTTESERQAVKGLLDGAPPQRGAEDDRAAESAAAVWMRTVPVVWPGFVRAVIDAAGCSAGPDAQVALVSVRYWPDGRAAHLTHSDQRLPASCRAAAAALAALTLHDIEHGPPSGQPELLVLPLDRDHVACASAPESASRRPVPLDSDAASDSTRTIKPPKRTRNVSPTYPAPLQDQGVEGTVLVEAMVTAAGCVCEQRIVRAPHVLFGLASLRAVSAWRFRPALLDDQPVPVTMTVTVTFTLR